MHNLNNMCLERAKINTAMLPEQAVSLCLIKPIEEPSQYEKCELSRHDTTSFDELLDRTSYSENKTGELNLDDSSTAEFDTTRVDLSDSEGCCPSSVEERMGPNIEFRDATDTVLFQESVSNDYPFEDIFYQYCPDAPRALLFYITDNIAISKRSCLNTVFASFDVKQLPIIVWARLPTPVDPNHCPQWQVIT
ncbi:hypothetical protein LPJ74_000101 [Coemansia sp. RSA 1843]|nr:hypothetical protein LPJ74_000101 [Coemansia sp. RSA 1843]